MNKMNIKFKLGVLFLILCVSIMVLAFKSISISEHNKQSLKTVHSKSKRVLQLQNVIITPLYKLRERTQSLVMAPNSTLRKSIETELNALIKSLDKAFEQKQKEHAQSIVLWQEYKTLIAQTKEYLKESFEEGAYVNVTTSSQEHFEYLLTTLLQQQNANLNDASIEYQSAVSHAKEVKISVIVSVIFIFLVSTVIGWWVVNNIITSIYKVQNGLNDFFAYLNHKKNRVEKIVIHSKDEFQAMASKINVNVKRIQQNMEQNDHVVKDATHVLENIKQGNLGERVTAKGNSESLNELKVMMNDMIDNLEEKIQNEIEQRLTQEQLLVQQSKLASMGEMIGNIAHQWRQPLAQIAAIHMNMKVTHTFDKFTKTYLDNKIKEANQLTSYMSQTISDFQNFFKPQGKEEYFGIKEACQSAYFIVESSLKYHNIEVIIDEQKEIEVYGYKNEYSQVILNILSNAKDILLERQIRSPRIQVQIKQGEQFAIVKIEDNAGGVDEKVIDKIFEPYFTTRHKTQGTGIGLYMSKNIIERNMKGMITVYNTKQGACFTVKIPKQKL